MTKEELIAEYRAAKTERDRADLEYVFWDTFGKTDGPQNAHLREKFVAEELGTDRYPLTMRLRLLGYGDMAAPLWERVEQDMLLKTAVDIAHQAKLHRERGETMADALGRALAEYDARPMVINAGGDKVIRKGQPRPRRVPLRAEPPERETEAEEAPEPASAPEGAPAEFSEKAFWRALRQLVQGYVDARLAGHPEIERLGQTQRLETELKVVFELFAGRIYDRKRFGTAAAAISRRSFIEACRTLLLDPPRTTADETPAFFKKVDRQARELCRQYHPDSHGGNGPADKFRAVTTAWNVVKAYRETLKGT